MPSLIEIIETKIGSIALWHGLLADIPKGWQLCDGTNGTPNLLDKFVRSVATAVTEPGDTGGEDTHILTESEIPSHSHGVLESSHTHSITDHGTAGATILLRNTGAANSGTVTTSSDALGAPSVGSKGGDTAHENKPSFFELAYIMRVS